MLRLIVIDSLYSTNAEYSYFSFEDMAEKIVRLEINGEGAEDYFYGLVEGKKDEESLFSSKYGIRKNLKEGSLQTSLMSKYAYYLLLQNPGNKYPLGFPIYDSLAIKMYPKAMAKATGNAKKSKHSTICEYIAELNELRQLIFEQNEGLYGGFQQYDLLDAYLWRMGKIDNGNFSLLFNRADYEKFITKLGLNISNEDIKNNKDFSKYLKERSNKNTKEVELIVNFNTVVKGLCRELKNDADFENISNWEYIFQLIQHWKENYSND